MKHGKKYTAAREKLAGLKQPVSAIEGINKIKELAFAKFDESIDVNVNLGIDPSKGEQVVRGSVVLPHGIGKVVKIVVFAKGDYADAAKKAGADYVGAEDLIEKIEGGWLDFNYAVATPDLMTLIAKVAKILGPKGLVPSKKTGTVTFDVKEAVSELKGGRLFFKNDKNAVVHFLIGKKSFDAKNLVENLKAFLKALSLSKPATAKGQFIKKVVVSSTMGIGIQISPEEIQ
jgi:large subunit ribosomal protein L1